jgi:hypothetical protein
MKTTLSTFLLAAFIVGSLGSCAPEPTAVIPPEKALIHSPAGQIAWTNPGSANFTLALNCGCSFTPRLHNDSGATGFVLDSASFKTNQASYVLNVSYSTPAPVAGEYVHKYIFSAPDIGVGNQVVRTLYDTVVVKVTIP